VAGATLHIHLVINDSAGGGSATDRIGGALAVLRSKVSLELHRPSTGEAARKLMSELAAAGAERIVIVGGDGTVHQAINALANTDCTLGLISAGTGNDTVTGLDLPGELFAACDAALGDAGPVDLIESGHGFAMTVAIVGFAVDVNERAESMRYPKGRAKYTLATMRELPGLTTHELTVSVDGVEHDVAPNLMAVANLPYFGGGMKVAPAARADDGELEVVIMGPAGRANFARLLPTVFSGRHVNNRRVTVLRGAEVAISGSEARLRADGEPWGQLPATLRARRGALQVAGIG